MRTLLLTSTLALLTPLAACGGQTDVASGPITAEKIEAIARDHLPEPTKAGKGTLDGSDTKDAVAARLTYGEEHVDVVVGPGTPDFEVEEGCAESFIECAELDTDVDGGTLTLLWQEEEPEEDPGIIVLLLQRDDESSLVRWGGDIVVTGDPRELDMEVSVDDAVDVLEDDRLRVDVP